MKTEKEIRKKLKVAEIIDNANHKLSPKYTEGWVDALKWVLEND